MTCRMKAKFDRHRRDKDKSSVDAVVGMSSVSSYTNLITADGKERAE